MRNILSENLRIFRQHNGLTQEDMARGIGITRELYNAIERGDRNVKVDRLLKICKATDLSPNDLLGFDVVPVRHVVLSSLLDGRCVDKLAKSKALQRVINQIILACDIDKLEKEAAKYAHDH